MENQPDTKVLQFRRPGPLKPVRIRMQENFLNFNEERRTEFVKDLQTLLGVSDSDMDDIQFRQGCVIFEGKLDKKAVEKLLKLFEHADGDKEFEVLKEFRQFLEKYSVVDITDEMISTFQVVTRSKTEEERRDQVVFIHGWRGDEKSFGDLPTYIASRLDCHCFIYDYPTGIREKSPHITYIASNMDNWMRNYITAPRVALVAHSMGGLVARKMLVRQALWPMNPQLDRQIRQITFIASPHNGAAFAKLGSSIPGLRKEQLSELEPNSPFIFELNEQWASWYAQNVPNHCIVRSMFGTDDTIVSVNNARGLDPNAIPILNADHTGIVKPVSPKDEVVVTLARLLKEAGIAGVLNKG